MKAKKRGVFTLLGEDFLAENCASKRSIDTYPWRYENPEKGYHFYIKVRCSKKFFVENAAGSRRARK